MTNAPTTRTPLDALAWSLISGMLDSRIRALINFSDKRPPLSVHLDMLRKKKLK